VQTALLPATGTDSIPFLKGRESGVGSGCKSRAHRARAAARRRCINIW
jgi:hypothetical protein